MKSLESLLDKIFSDGELCYGVISSPRLASQQDQKIEIRPISSKSGRSFQVTTFRDQKAFHTNVNAEECKKIVSDSLSQQFKQALFCTAYHDYHVLISKKQKITILQKTPTKKPAIQMHNRKKNYLLEEGTPISFLIALGIMNRDGSIKPDKRDKFKQLNRFLELIADVLPQFVKGQKLHIVDFGCGKAYLTFALYYFLSSMQGFELEIRGLDLKEDVIRFCQKLARDLNYTGLDFTVGDINQYDPQVDVDMVISLHACDTATDAAIEKAVRWNSKVILCVPCCQHELMGQIKNSSLAPLLNHGILKERFAALATDAARAQLLEVLGYQTQVLEFIDLEHTPKNLLIRAFKKKGKEIATRPLQEYKIFKEALSVEPSLEKRFQKELLEMQW